MVTAQVHAYAQARDVGSHGHHLELNLQEAVLVQGAAPVLHQVRQVGDARLASMRERAGTLAELHESALCTPSFVPTVRSSIFRSDVMCVCAPQGLGFKFFSKGSRVTI